MLLALLSSGLWGTSDFAGGMLSRRRPVAVVVFTTQLFGLLGLTVLALAAGLFTVDERAFAWGAGAGVVGLIALLAFYRALSIGTMGIVAPITATGVALPVLVGLARGERPAAVQVAGILLAATGVIIAARPAVDETLSRRAALQPTLLALVAALGFGSVFVALAQGSQGSVSMTLFAARLVAVPLVGGYLVTRRIRPPLLRPRGQLAVLAMTGTFDLLANGTYSLATQRGLESVVAVLSSLYPVVTVLLARRVLGERLRRWQLAGIGGALTGVLLLAAG